MASSADVHYLFTLLLHIPFHRVVAPFVAYLSKFLLLEILGARGLQLCTVSLGKTFQRGLKTCVRYAEHSGLFPSALCFAPVQPVMAVTGVQTLQLSEMRGRRCRWGSRWGRDGEDGGCW